MASKAQFEFTEANPDLDSYWRGIVLFGANVASYKFALAKSLLEISSSSDEELVPLEVLADPFSRHICEHLAEADKQSTSASSRFLDACRSHNKGELGRDELIEQTAQLGFANVIDAFHNVGGQETSVRFFEDARGGTTKGIRITEGLRDLLDEFDQGDLNQEAESRWRLVETAWSLNLPKHMLNIGYDHDLEVLITPNVTRRKEITPAREALNGYQRGQCFYCFGGISILPISPYLAHVDHFFPHWLKQTEIGQEVNLDGVWNLVLACQTCNGAAEKGGKLPAIQFLERLNRRNEFLIASHDPLRETLMIQTGATPQARGRFLDSLHAKVRRSGAGLNTWTTEPQGVALF